jgi:hypothetical protein
MPIVLVRPLVLGAALVVAAAGRALGGTSGPGGTATMAPNQTGATNPSGTANQAGTPGPGTPDTCSVCHASLPDGRLGEPARRFARGDIHRESGFTCADCHGGDRTASQAARAHDPARRFTGRPAGQAIVGICGRCHGDAEMMRRYAPRQRVDQAIEYETSVHGRRLAAGDARVATCASCHDAHGIRSVKDVQSPVFRTNVSGTCGRCHADASYMSPYTLPGGSALPTNQLAEYQKSVHYAALTKGNDLAAPTCNDCHGNHGAVPPGAGSVANVCGACHGVFAQKFEMSVHREIFEKGCVECHGNHAVTKPSDEMLGTDAHAICSMCHAGADDKGAAAAAAMRSGIERLKAGIAGSTALVARVRNAGIDMSAPELALAEARSRLTLARTEMHAFAPARVATIVDDGLKIVVDADAAGERGVRELTYRRRGLAASLVAILLVVVALALKIRQIEGGS